MMTSLPAVELYSIGTELLMGQIQDSNAFWMAQQIAAVGGYVRRMTVLDDEIDQMISAFQRSVERETRVIITTGGLGPTPDDLTVEAVAKLMGVEIVVNDSLLSEFMKRRGVTDRNDMNPGMVKMATSPRGSTVHPNPAGVAPCVESTLGKTTIFNLPGPPREVEALFEQSIQGVIADLYTGNRATLRVAVNLPESEVGPILHRVMQNHPNTYLKAYVALRERVEDGQRLPVDIVARAESQKEAEVLLKAARNAFAALVSEKGKEVEILEQ